MTDTQVVNQLKFKISSLQSQLADKQRALEQYQTIESEADAKIKAISKMHADKVKNLLNSIQVLKKQKASIQGLSKEHKRSKLIQQLNKQIGDQDLAIEVLRKWIYEKQGKQKGRQICDQTIVSALTKGPQRIRPLSREQLKMEIQRLKSLTINLQAKMKNGKPGSKNIIKGANNDEQLSEVSSVSQQSFVNQNDEILKKLRQLQFENQNMKVQVNAKLKIIQKLKIDLRQTQKLRTDLQIFKNEVEVANKKVSTYEKLMKQSKQNTNTKIIQLYERQIKVQELQMMSKQNREKLKQAQQTNNILLQQAKLQKQQLQAQIENLIKQNEQMILQNVGQKKRLDELKKIVKDMDDLHGKQKEDMKSKVTAFESQLEQLVTDNKKYESAYRNAEATLFSERAQWIKQKNRLLQQIQNLQQIKTNNQLSTKNLQELQRLKKQNSELNQILKSGGGGNDKTLLDRLKAQQQKIDFLQGKSKLSQGQRQNELYKMYNQLLKKYEDLLSQFQAFKRKYGPKQKKLERRQVIELTQKQKSQFQVMSSGVSRLGLEDVDSDILDNFDSSLQYEFVINENGQKVKMPKLTEADKELLKLMTSDLWVFVNDDKMQKKLQKAIEFVSEDEDIQINYQQIRQLRNLSNPQGKKVMMYEQQVGRLNEISDSVSVTSALDKQLNKFDSDVNIQIKRLPKGAFSKPINPYKVQDASLSVDQCSSLSSVKSGESNIGKKKKKVQDKGSRIQMKKMMDSDFENSSIGSALLDSDVSSDGIRQSQLAMMSSDVDGDFKKKK